MLYDRAIGPATKWVPNASFEAVVTCDAFRRARPLVSLAEFLDAVFLQLRARLHAPAKSDRPTPNEIPDRRSVSHRPLREWFPRDDPIHNDRSHGCTLRC